jgi:hypothetical protein
MTSFSITRARRGGAFPLPSAVQDEPQEAPAEVNVPAKAEDLSETSDEHLVG